MMHGDCRLSKTSPIKYLKPFLTQYSPTYDHKFCVMDLGGELYSTHEVQTLFQSFGYKIYPTGSDASFQNGPVKRGHKIVSIGIKSLLTGVGLKIKFWLCVFMYVLRLCNAIPSHGKDESPLLLATGEKDNVKYLKAF